MADPHTNLYGESTYKFCMANPHTNFVWQIHIQKKSTASPPYCRPGASHELSWVSFYCLSTDGGFSIDPSKNVVKNLVFGILV